MKILMIGGLGNQIFQFVQAHSNFVLGFGKPCLVLNPIAPKDRSMQLLELITKCPHIDYVVLNQKLLRSRLRLLNRVDQIGLKPITSVVEFILGVQRHSSSAKTIEDWPWRPSWFLRIGFFQDFKSAEQVWHLCGEEFEEFIENSVESLNFREMEKVIGVHIRRGDYVQLQESFGLLSSQYYRQVIESIKKSYMLNNVKVVVFTDNPLEAGNVIHDIRANLVFGPEIDPWQTIKALSECDFIIAANSTLSWWACFFAHKQGRVVFLPKPWFKEVKSVDQELLFFPFSIAMPSHFEEEA